MRRSLAACAICLAALSGGAAAGYALSPAARITTKGLGPIEIGMTERQVEQAGGRAITLEGPGAGNDCTTAQLGTDVFGLFTGPRLARVYVRGRPYATRKGIRTGDTQRKVIATHGRALSRSPHKYLAGGLYLRLTIGNRRVVFETDGRRVTQISSGRRPEVDYVEGCA